MATSASSTAARTCPNCHAALPQGGRQCPVCKMDIAKMGAYAAAKRAAQEKGMKTTEVQMARHWVKPVVAVVVLLLIVGGVVVWMRGGIIAAPVQPAWVRFPASREAVARQFVSDIATGRDEGYARAYHLVAPSAKDPNDSDEEGKYRQTYHVMWLYLSGEFGQDWGNHVSFAQNKDDPNVVDVHVDVETLHVALSDQTPAAEQAAGHHFAVMGINEFDVQNAAKYQQAMAIGSILKSYAGQGNFNNLQQVMGAMGGGGHETHMEMKLRLLPKIANPHTINKYEIYQTWPVRNDPVVRRRLEEITGDERFSGEMRAAAKEVLDDNVDETERIAAHVQEN